MSSCACLVCGFPEADGRVDVEGLDKVKTDVRAEDDMYSADVKVEADKEVDLARVDN